MLISSAVSPIGLGCGGGSVRCFSFAANFNPWPRIQTKQSAQPMISKPPHLMLCSPAKPQIRYLYDLGEDSTVIKLNREIYLPEIAGQHCVGSSHGFVFAILDDGGVVAVNPLSGDKLCLPSIPRVLPEDAISEGPFIDVHSKVTLSPSLDIAVLIRRTFDGSFTYGYPYFARLTPPMDDAWTPIPSLLQRIHDCAFHKGQLFTVNRNGDLSTYKDVGKPSKTRARFHLSNINYCYGRKYLVESPDGDDLFLVCCKQPILTPWLHEERFFLVWRLDKNDMYMWKPVDSLGGLVFFVGPVRSFSLPAADFPCLKPDSIYFTTELHIFDDHFPGKVDGLGGIGLVNLQVITHIEVDYLPYKVYDLGDTGVFNLQDETVQYFRLPDTEDGVDWLPPTWVVP